MSSNSYAIIKTGGKQYRVAQDDVIDIELLDAELGSKVEFSEVLFFHDGATAHVGTPSVAGCTINGELLEIVKGDKISSVKYKKRKNYRKKWGHRQSYARVKITTIGSGKSKKAKVEAEG
jgi:large subunit ribosomal protein L21